MLIQTMIATLLAGLTLAAPAAPSGPTHGDHVDLTRPGSLERGEDVRVPHLEGSELVDGDLRIELGSVRVQLLGPSGDDYVVHRWTQRSGRDRILRVTPAGDRTVLLRGRAAWGSVLSSDGAHVLANDNARRATVTAYDATDGTEISRARFRGFAEILDADGGTVLVTSWRRERTLAWDFAEGGRSLVTDAVGYAADLASDRLATYTGDPYQGGCSEVSSVSDPDLLLWDSCRQKVLAFSPGGARMVTAHILTDGVGPGEVQQRTVEGALLTSYESRWFGTVAWEDEDTLLLDANSRRREATVRCDLDACERASDLHPSSP